MHFGTIVVLESKTILVTLIPKSMKRTVFLSALFLILGITGMNKVMAQEGAKVGFSIRPMVSWASTVTDSTKQKPIGIENKSGVGFAFDFIFTYGFSDKIAFKSGINISSRKVGFASTVTGVDLTSKTSLTSIEVPLGLKFRSPEIGSGLYIVGLFGVTPEINFSNKVVTDLTLLGVRTQSETQDSKDVNIFTTSFSPGAGVDMEFDWGMLEFTATYNLGLMSYTNKKNTGVISKISSIGLNVGYFF
jgi:Outer membrane protein beta-barrel domain